MSLAQQRQAGESAADTENLSTYVRRMMSLDRNSDGLLSKAELPGDLTALLTKHDEDGDGNLSPSELAEILRGKSTTQTKRTISDWLARLQERGYIKRIQQWYIGREATDLLPTLRPGERTPLFHISDASGPDAAPSGDGRWTAPGLPAGRLSGTSIDPAR